MAPRGPPSTSSWQPLASLKLESTVRARSRITCEHCGPEVSSISQRRTSKVDSLPSSERSRPPQPVSTGGRQCSGTGRRSSGFRRVSCSDCRAPRVLLLRRKTPPRGLAVWPAAWMLLGWLAVSLVGRPGWLASCLAGLLPGWLLAGCLAAWLPGCLSGWLPACLRACVPACVPACLCACMPEWLTAGLPG